MPSSIFPNRLARRLQPALWLLPVLLFLSLLISTVGWVNAQDTLVPDQTPDAEIGLEIFQARCANCHGVLGMGDGELASRSPVPPPALADSEFRRQLAPEQMFHTITDGIMSDAGPIMPAFGPVSSEPISEQDRWNLIAAVFGLGLSTGDLVDGEALYTANCAECHGEDGREAFDLTDQTYWSGRSNQVVFETLQGDAIVEHTYDLAQDELWQLVDYSRAFSYLYSDPLAAFAPIPEGEITGMVTNGTLAERATDPMTVTLSAFTPAFEVSFTQTVTLSEEGDFRFLVDNVAPDLFYVVTTNYDGLQFGSDFGELDGNDPSLTLPLTVYETTTDPSGISIEQMHVILEFADERVAVSELYQFINDSLTVYTGPSGDPDAGTVDIALPEGAQNVQFSHTFGSIDNLLPTDSIIQTESGWADTIPVRPGRASLNLLVRYDLPYEDELTLAHPVSYDVANVNMVMADAGVQLENDGVWLDGGAQQMGEALFLTYSQASVPADTVVTIPLTGQPQITAPTASMAVTAGDSTTEILVGAGVLLLVVGSVGYYVNLKRQQPRADAVSEEFASDAFASDEFAGEAFAGEDVASEDLSLATAQASLAQRREALLIEIVDLDDAFERGELDEPAYALRRRELIKRLVAVWRVGREA